MTAVNMAESVHQRLLNLRDESGEQFERLLVRYGAERLLYRLQVAGYVDSFVLKGAMLFALWQDMPARPTRDLDLLGFGENTHENLQKIFTKVCTVDTVNDGLDFDPATIQSEDIREADEYQGIRIRMTTFLGRARVPIQIDIGFGDVITPPPEVIDYPVLLDFPSPRIRAYHPATVIAEKFNAMIVLGILNSRMKDFYDVYRILLNMKVRDEDIANAIASTFKRRNVSIPSDLPPVFKADFVNEGNKETEWRAFLKRSNISCELTLFEVLNYLRKRLWPVVNRINTR